MIKTIKKLTLAVGLGLLAVACSPTSTSESETTETTENTENMQERAAYALVIHGGAGTIRKENMTDEMEKAYRSALNEALNIGENVLKNGGSSLEALSLIHI